MAKLLGLRCRECGTEYELQATHVCEMCFGPLDVVYDQAALKKVVSRDRIERGPASMWRYRDLLPIEDETPVVSLGEGFTPLVKAERLGAELGLRNLYLKNDSMNPTNSFKDRVVSVAISWARANGFETIACASTGNLANAVAAYAARAGLECFVFIPVDLEPAKVVSISVFDPNVVAVRGNYDEVNRLCSQLLESTPWAFCNINIRPFYAEGSKTLTFEAVEQLGWRLPDEIIILTAGGVTIGVLAKLARAGRWKGDEVVVAYVTGHGLKTADVLASVDGHARRVEIDPTLKSFREKVNI